MWKTPFLYAGIVGREEIGCLSLHCVNIRVHVKHLLLLSYLLTGCVELQFHTDRSAAVFFVKGRRISVALMQCSNRLTLPDNSKVVETLHILRIHAELLTCSNIKVKGSGFI